MKGMRPDALRDSGVPAIGRIPSHWTVSPLKHVIKSLEQGWSPECDSRPAVDGEWAVLKVGCVNGGRFDPHENKALPTNLQGMTHLALRKGDVLVSRANTRDLVGSCAVVPIDYPRLMLCDKLYRLRTSPSCVPDYLALAITVVGRGRIEAEASGASSSMLNISQSIIRELPLPLPPVTEQRQIVRALRRVLRRVETLVSKQERLIALLAEKRQAVISHAVTKGLNPDLPMRNSGVQTVGMIPVHWSMRRLKHVTPEVTVGIVVEPSQYYADTGVPALRSLNIRPGFISLDEMVFITEAANANLAKSRLRTGDLVAVRSGQPGTTAMVPEHLDGCNCIDLIIIRKPTGIVGEFLCWYLNCASAVGQFASGSGGAIQQHFNVGAAVNMSIPVPPASEQQAISRHLSGITAALDALIEKSRGTVALMREHRAALITAAVTGKIDVRDSVEDVA